MFNEQEIIKLSKKYNLTCNIFPNAIYINSPYRNWICESVGDFYRLKHQNAKQLKDRTHFHKDKYYDLEEVFKFINWHDTHKLIDRYRKRRLRFENLFSQM